MHRRFLGGALALAAACSAAPAAADTYTVLGCRTPAGATNAAAGWTAAATDGAAATSGCPQGGALTAQLLAANPAGGTNAKWSFAAPADTRIVRLAARRTTAGLGSAAQNSGIAYLLKADDKPLEECRKSETTSCPADLAEPVDKAGLDAGSLTFQVICFGGSDERCQNPLRLDVAQVAVGLKDSAAPQVANVRVVDDGDRSGVLTVAFDAADRGGGLYRAVVRVDGQAAQVVALGDAQCADADPANADAYEFTVPVPCPPAVSQVPVRLDVRTLPAGVHTVEIEVEDAAGNVASVHTTQFPRANVGASSTRPVDLRSRLRVWFDRNRAKRFTSRFGRRVVTRGVLRDSRGRPIVGARIDVVHILSGGRRRLSKTGLKTRAGGKLTLILPLNIDTRRIEFAYRAVRPGPVTSRQTLRVTVLDRRGRVYRRR